MVSWVHTAPTRKRKKKEKKKSTSISQNSRLSLSLCFSVLASRVGPLARCNCRSPLQRAMRQHLAQQQPRRGDGCSPSEENKRR